MILIFWFYNFNLEILKYGLILVGRNFYVFFIKKVINLMVDFLFLGYKWYLFIFVFLYRIYVRVYRYKLWNLNFKEMFFKDMYLIKNFL